MIRRYTEHVAKNEEQDRLRVVIVYEANMSKEKIKQDNPYSKEHGKVVFK